jgi:hypothetical protein
LRRHPAALGPVRGEDPWVAVASNTKGPIKGPSARRVGGELTHAIPFYHAALRAQEWRRASYTRAWRILVGRPKLEPMVTQRIVDLIRAGNFLEVAATAAGIHRSTLHRWLRHGRSQARGRYRKFLNAVEKAQAESESRDVALIAKAASTDWRAAAWRLERKIPRRYGLRVQVSVQQELEAILDRLQAGLLPEAYEKVLELMAADDAQVPDTGHGEEISES